MTTLEFIKDSFAIIFYLLNKELYLEMMIKLGKYKNYVLKMFREDIGA